METLELEREAPRGRNRWRMLLLAPVAALVALVLPFSTAPAGAAPPPIVPIIGTDLTAGVPVTAGTLSLGGTMVLVTAGLGAYDGTCALLTKLVNNWSDCGTSAHDGIFNLLTKGSWTGNTTPAQPAAAGACTFYLGGTRLIKDAFAMCAGWPANAGLLETTFCSGTGCTQPYYLGPQGGGKYGFSDAWCAAINKPEACPNPFTQLQNAIVEGANFTGRTTTYWRKSDYIYVGTLAQATAVWVMAGHVEPYTATITETCTNTDGSTFTRSATLTYTPVAGQKSPDIHLPNCWDVTPGAVRTKVASSVATPSLGVVGSSSQDTVDTTRYPACATTKCVLTPEYLPTGTKCFTSATAVTAADDCVDQWPTESQNPSQWRCWYGSYRVSLSTCEGAYPKLYFSNGVSTLPDPNVDPAPSPSPSPSGGTSLPTTGANPEAPPGVGTAPTGGTDVNGTSCWSTGWSWNPVSWVVTPVECALKWAFVPSQTVLQDAINGTRTAVGVSTPGKWWAALGGLTPPAGAGGCSGPSVDFTVYGKPFHAEPLNACSGAMATFAGVAKIFISAGVVLFGGFACIRVLGAGLGWNASVGT